PVPVLHPERRRRAGDAGARGARRDGAAGSGTIQPVINPRVDELLDNVDSRYALVIVAAKRARQINNYHHQLGEGMGFEDAPPPPPSASSGPRPSTRSRGGRRTSIRTRTWSAPTCS